MSYDRGMTPATICRFSLVFLSLILVSQAASGLQSVLRLEHLGVQDGLSHGAIKTIAQDSHGFIWIGTANGLNRFDGLELRNYRAENTVGSLDNDYIRDILLAHDGTLWIATGQGISRYNPQGGHFTNYPLPTREGGENTLAYKISEDSEGDLWVATGGLGLARFEREQERYTLYQHDPEAPESTPSSNFLYTVKADPSGGLWLGTRSTGLDFFEPERGRNRNWRHNAQRADSLSHNIVYSVLIDHQGQIWAGTRGGGLNRLRPDQQGFDRFQHDPDNNQSLAGNRIWGMIEDQEKALWIVTETGVSRMQARYEGLFQSLRNDPLVSRSLPTNAVNAVFQSADGVLWFGTYGSGVSRVDPAMTRFGLVRHEPTNPDSLPHNHILSMRVLDDELWLGTTEGLIRRHRDGRFQRFRYKPGDPSTITDDLIRSIEPHHDGRIWLGTQNAGLSLFDPTTGTSERFLQKPIVDDEPIRGQQALMALLTDSSGQLWIGSRDGLISRNPQTGEFHFYLHDPEDADSLPANRVLDLALDQQGRLLVATTAGLARLEDQHSRQFRRFQHNPDSDQGLSSNTASTLHVSPDGTVWIGTFGGGLNRLDSSNDQITPVSRARGLEADSIQSIEQDDQGDIWLGTASGLYRYNPDNDMTLRYTEADGLQATHFEHGASTMDQFGRLYFGGVDGYNRFSPEQIPIRRPAPKSVITDVLVYDGRQQSVASERPRLTGGLPPESITLSAAQRIFSVRFAAMNYSTPRQTQFRYRMHGLDSGWHYTDANRNTITWSHLPSGRYQLEVQAAGQRDSWGQPARLELSKQPSWWLSPAAFLGYALLLVLMLAAAILRAQRLRIAERRHRVELKREVRNRTRKLRQRNRQLHLAQNQLMTQEKMASLGSLVAGVSHEINTPLGIGVTAASQLQNALRRFRKARESEQLRLKDLTNFEATIDEGADIILRNLRRATELMRSFKQVAVDQTGEQYRDFNLNQYLQESLAALGPKIRQARAEIELECPDDINMSGYPGAIYQIVANLVMNSLIHGFDSLTDERPRRIMLNARKLENQRVELRYSDNGRGMDQATLRKVFDPFFTTRLGEGGSGLGMHIVYNLCTQLLQGSIDIQSQPDAGIEVSMVLPHVLDARPD